MSLGWGPPSPGQGRGGGKGPNGPRREPSCGLSAPSWSGWAGWGPGWLQRAAHHKPGLKLNCRVLGRPGGSGQPGVTLLGCRELIPGTHRGSTRPSWPISLLEHLVWWYSAPLDAWSAAVGGSLWTGSGAADHLQPCPRPPAPASPSATRGPHVPALPSLTPRVWGRVPSAPTTVKGRVLPGQ